MGYVVFIVVILALIAIMVLLRKSEIKTKNKYKKTAYRLLEESAPSTDEILKTLKFLRLYGGRWRKDKEFAQLINRLSDKLELIEKKQR